MTIDIDALRDRFSTFVACLEDPGAGATLAELYHPSAMVITSFDPQPLEDVGPFMFAMAYQSSWDMYGMNHPDGGRRPSLGEPRLLSWRVEGDDRLVAWWEADEQTDGRTVLIATGFRLDIEDWLLGWLTLDEAVGEWSYGYGQARMLADYEYAHANLDIMPRSWLDLAYFRLYGHAKPVIATLPDARFACGMSSVCCSIDYRITVQAGAKAFIDAVPWDEIHPPLAGVELQPVEGDDQFLLKDAGSPCQFLDENRHCRIHKAFGRPVFNACTQFPLRFAGTPDGVIVAGSPLCGSVRSNLGPLLADKQAELQGRLAIRGAANLIVPETYHVTRATDATWETFKAAEALLIAALDRTDLPLRRRLWLGSRLLMAAELGRPLAFDPAWETEPMTGPGSVKRDEAEAALAVLARGMDIERPAPMQGAKETPGSVREGWLTGVIKNILFSKTYSYAISLVAAHHVCVVLALFVERLEAKVAPEPLPEPLVINLAMRIFHGQLHAFLREDERMSTLLDRPWLGAAWLAAEALEPV
jgi:hypothetical protein